MKIEETIIRKFIADDGKEFNTEQETFDYEMALAQKKVGNAPKYVVGYLYSDGTGNFTKFKFREFKTVPSRYDRISGTTNVKYATKFNSFEEAYSAGIRSYSNCALRGNQVLTLEEAEKASKISEEKKKHDKLKEQRYVCEFDKDPSEDGEYITNLGMVKFKETQWPTYNKPTFWMRKVNKTSRY